jgi:hypothetical protein
MTRFACAAEHALIAGAGAADAAPSTAIQASPSRISMARNQNDMWEARRRFLARCGKYAAVTPPTVGLLLSAAKQNYAVASSGGYGDHGHGDRDHGHSGDHDDRGHDGRH